MGEVVRFPSQAPEAPERLWRELVGEELHRERTARGERLKDVAERAGVSIQYLSEVERGLKDPSSEMLQAIAGALDLSVRELATPPRAPRRWRWPPSAARSDQARVAGACSCRTVSTMP